MGKHVHLMQRGDVFYWRRRLPAKSTNIECLQLSLRTKERSEAYIIARRLTSESDRMFDRIIPARLTPDDMRLWLTHVITAELARIRQRQMMDRFDPVRPDLDVAHDRATSLV